MSGDRGGSFFKMKANLDLKRGAVIVKDRDKIEPWKVGNKWKICLNEVANKDENLGD